MDKLAIYLRLSLEDADDKDESNSISSQRAMLHAYIRGNGELRDKEVSEFCDDGYVPFLKGLYRAWNLYEPDIPIHGGAVYRGK